MKKICVLGAGLVGSAIARDLSKKYTITTIDNNQDSLNNLSNYDINTVCGNLTDTSFLKDRVQDFDLVIGAVPGFMGYKLLRTIIECKKNIVDISFFPEDPFDLDELAIKNNVTAVVDCGVAPGMGNIILGYHNKRMNIENYKCYVGGLPKKKEWPFKYKAPFSPIDVIEEYTRPARFVKNGELITREALTDLEKISFQECGTLEAFNTDGLRTLIKTMRIPNMIEKTMRYEGTVKYLKAFKKAGLFNREKINISGIKISPIEVSAKLLLPLWKISPEDKEFTIMRIEIEGEEEGLEKKYNYTLYDEFNTESKTSSMARTTGYTCTAVATLILSGKFSAKGICPPEYLGESEENFKFIVNYLKKRGVEYKASI